MGERSAEDVEDLDESPLNAEQVATEAHWAQVEANLRNGANWFYWIAGLSIVNSVILLSEGKSQFLAGLGITQIASAVALHWGQRSPELAVTAKIIAGAITLVIAALVAAFGFGTNRRLSWLFIVGMVLYTFDGWIYVLYERWLSVAFHAFVLTKLFGGFRACRQLNAVENQRPVHDE